MRTKTPKLPKLTPRDFNGFVATNESRTWATNKFFAVRLDRVANPAEILAWATADDRPAIEDGNMRRVIPTLDELPDVFYPTAIALPATYRGGPVARVLMNADGSRLTLADERYIARFGVAEIRGNADRPERGMRNEDGTLLIMPIDPRRVLERVSPELRTAIEDERARRALAPEYGPQALPKPAKAKPDTTADDAERARILATIGAAA